MIIDQGSIDKKMARQMEIIVAIVTVICVAAGAEAMQCQTNAYSPLYEHAAENVRHIQNLPWGQQCCQNVYPQGCTEMASWYTSKAAICGPRACTLCMNVAQALQGVLYGCQQRDYNGNVRVEGFETVGQFNVHIYRSNDGHKPMTKAEMQSSNIVTAENGKEVDVELAMPTIAQVV